MSTETATLNLAEALHSAADLVRAIGWDGGATWSSTDDLGLHARTGADRDAVLRLLTALGAEVAERPLDGYELHACKMPDGLTVSLYLRLAEVNQ